MMGKWVELCCHSNNWGRVVLHQTAIILQPASRGARPLVASRFRDDGVHAYILQSLVGTADLADLISDWLRA